MLSDLKFQKHMIRDNIPKDQHSFLDNFLNTIRLIKILLLHTNVLNILIYLYLVANFFYKVVVRKLFIIFCLICFLDMLSYDVNETLIHCMQTTEKKW